VRDHAAALLYPRCALKSGSWEAHTLASALGRCWLAAGAVPESAIMREAA
jgi:hypothetical protein